MSAIAAQTMSAEIVAETLPLAKKQAKIAPDRIIFLATMPEKQCASCGLMVQGPRKGQVLPRQDGPGVSHGICGECRDIAMAKRRADRAAEARPGNGL